MAMQPVLSNRDVLMAVIFVGGLILASAVAFGSVLHEPQAGVGAVEPSTLAGGSAVADVPTVAYLDASYELAISSSAMPNDVSSVRAVIP
jgi:hypothetical protein